MRVARVFLSAVAVVLSADAASAQLSPNDVYRIIRHVYDREGFEITGAASRDSMNLALARAVGIVHHGHPVYNPTPDRRWCIKNGGPGRPQSDDVVARCDTRDAWDLIGGIGGPNPVWAPSYIGVLPSIQQIYPPPVPGSYVGGTVTLSATVSRPRVALRWTPAAVGPATVSHTLIASTFGRIPVGSVTAVSADVPDGSYSAYLETVVGGITIRRSNSVAMDVGVFALPGPPLGLTQTVSGNVASFVWQPPLSDGGAPVRGYVLEAGLAPGAAVYSVALDASGTFVTPPVAAGSYFVRVRARTAGGVGPPSAEVHVNIGVNSPSAPTLSGNSFGPGHVLLNWLPPTSGAPVQGYRLLAGTQPGTQNAAVLDLPASHEGFAATDVPPGTYYVRVVAVSAVGFGDVSNELTLVIP